MQEGRVIIAQRIFDFVADCETRPAQEARLPDLRDPCPQKHFIAPAFTGVEKARAFGKKRENVTLGIEQAFALHLGRMRGEHRRHQALPERAHDLILRHPGLVQKHEGPRETAFRRGGSRLAFGQGAPPDLIAILSYVGEIGKITEGSNDRNRLFGCEATQKNIKRMASLGIGIALEGDTQTANGLDPLETFDALLFANGLAEDLPKQANIVDEGIVRGKWRIVFHQWATIGKGCFVAPFLSQNWKW